MNYIVLDLEWNQGNELPTEEPKEVPFEIIEIGAVKLNDDRVMIDEFSELIKPQIYKTMHYVTSKLIHLKMQELSHEKPFPEVMREFLKWCGEDYVFCTWGPLDLTELQRNMKYYGFDLFSDRPFAFYDVQKLFALDYDEAKTRRALESAIDMLHIEKDIPFHRAFSDAYYTAKVFARIHNEDTLTHYSYDVYSIPKTKDEEIHCFFPDYEKYISRAFETKELLLADKEVRNTNCYLCRKLSKKKVKLFTPNGKNYLSLSICEQHGFVKTKVRIRKTEDEKYYTIKTRKIVTEEEANDIISRQEKAKEYKKTRKAQVLIRKPQDD